MAAKPAPLETWKLTSPETRVAAFGWLTVLVFILAGLRNVLAHPTTRIIGVEIDSIHYLWGLWWLPAQLATPDGLAGPSYLVNWPAGMKGAVIAPLTALLMVPMTFWKGAIAAYNLNWVFNLALMAAGTAALAGRVTGNRMAGALAGAVVLASRPPFFNVGMGQLHGTSIGWIGLAGALWWGSAVSWRRALAGGVLMGVALVESPYAIVPVVGCCAVFGLVSIRRAWRYPETRRATLTALLAGAAGVMVCAAPYGLIMLATHAKSAVGNRFVMQKLTVRGLPIPLLDSLHYAPKLRDAIDPLGRPDWQGGAARVLATGHGIYLGLVGLLLAISGRGGRRWLLLAWVFLVLSLGTLIRIGNMTVVGPFGWINAGLDAVMRPLSKPDFYMSYASMALAVGAAVSAIERLGDRPVRLALLITLVGIDGVLAGGPSLATPAIQVGDGRCLAALTTARPGPVHYLEVPRRSGPRPSPPGSGDPGAPPLLSNRAAGSTPLPSGGRMAGDTPSWPGSGMPGGPPLQPGGAATVAAALRITGRGGSSRSGAPPSPADEADSLMAIDPRWPASQKRALILQTMHGQPATHSGIEQRWEKLGPTDPRIAALVRPGHPVRAWLTGGEATGWSWDLPVRWVLVSDPERRLPPGPLGAPVARCGDLSVYEGPWSSAQAEHARATALHGPLFP